MILLLGSTGYVGQAFVRYLTEEGLTFHATSSAQGDLSDPAVLNALLETHSPAFVINAAGFPGVPNVDVTETQAARCIRSNALLPVQAAECCAKRGIPFGHVSTGCIYFGARPDGGGFTEEDPPNFGFNDPTAGLYSGCKAVAESILRRMPQVYIWRLRMPFNHIDHPRNYLSKLLRYSCLLDARNSISQLDEFARICVQSCLRRIPFGIYNLTNPGSISTREIVRLLQETELGRGRAFEFFENESQFLAKAAKVRRALCIMDSSKIAQAGLPMRPVEDAVRDAIQRWIPAPS